MKKITTFLLKHEYLIWILCLCAILRLPSLLEPYWYGDEGIYLVLGNAVRRGLHLYRDIHDNKPPIIYWMAAITGSVFWFRFFLLAWNSVAIVAFERLSRVLFGETDDDGEKKIFGISFPIPRWSTLATLLFAIVPFFAEGAIANGEIFMIMPVIVGVLLLWQMANGKWQMAKTACVGLLFSLAFLTKVPALFDAVAVGFFFFLVSAKDLKTFWRSKYMYVFIASFFLPIALTIVYFFAMGAGKQYVVAAFAQNIGYLSTWSGGSHQASTVTASGLKNRALILGVALIALWALAKKNGKVLTFLLMWFALALFGALLSERPYPHYLIQVVPPVILLVIFQLRSFYIKVVSIQNTVLRKPTENSYFILHTLFFAFAIAILLYAVLSIKFWYYPLLPYYQNYIRFVTKQETKETYLRYFGSSLPDLYALSEFVSHTTSLTDRIFVWGDDPMVYALSRRLPPGRFTSAYHIHDFHGEEETAVAIQEKIPTYIILNTRYAPPYDELAHIIDTAYSPRYTFGPFQVYRYIATDPSSSF